MFPGRWMEWRLLVVWSFLPLAIVHAATQQANRLTYLEDAIDPYYVDGAFPKLVASQWVGQSDIRAVVVLAIDDMRDPAHYENYLRPILERLKAYQSRSLMSIMTNQVDPQNAQLQSWLKEGLSIEIHTIDHPCPLLFDGDFAKAQSTYERCIDLMSEIPGNVPVAFRMPCCDSMNSPSPRFYQEIFPRSTPAGHFLSIDSSVFNVITTNDASLPAEITRETSGASRFEKYVQFSSFVNTIRDYPFPYVIGRVCWEFPCVVPSDWEAQHLHKPFNPKTVEDMQAALDAVVQKQGTFNLVFHPHGWIRNDQVVSLIDHAEQKYGKQVLFLSFREALNRLNQYLLGGVPLRAADGSDQGQRLLDLNHDGYLDVARLTRDAGLVTRIWDPVTQKWRTQATPLRAKSIHFGVLQASGSASLLAVDGVERMLWHLRDGQWTAEALHVDPTHFPGSWAAAWHNSQTQIHYRFRDVDADGVCELMCDAGDGLLVLRREADGQWRPLAPGLPAFVKLARSGGEDAGLRWVDLDQDGVAECLWSDPVRAAVFKLSGTTSPVWETLSNELRSESAKVLMPPFVRADGTNHGVWFHSQHLWVQNEDTAHLPDKVDRLAFADIREPKSRVEEKKLQPTAAWPDPLEPKAALAEFRSSAGVQVEFAAAEPLVVDPVAMDWGPDGRMYVAEMRDYPTLEDGQTPRGRIKVLTDEDHDGVYDRAEVFLDHVPFPNGVKFWRRGVLVTSVPNVIYAEDTDGDFKADRQTILYSGFGEGNPQHRVNGLVWGIDNWLYLANGDSGGEIRSMLRDETIDLGGRDLRIRPDDGRIEVVAGQTQFGRVRDEEGNWFGCNNSEPLWHFVIEDRYLARNPNYASPVVRQLVPDQPGAAPIFPSSRLLPRYNDFDRANRFTSVCGPAVLRDSGFGAVGSIDLFVCEPVHNLVHRQTMRTEGASFRSRRVAEDQEAEFLASRDNWFRPVMVRQGPDGALWVADMYRLIIEHPEWIPATEQARVNLRAGEDRGRIYRLRPRGAGALQAVEPLTGLSTEQLVARLEHPVRWQRDMAHQMLLWHNDRSAIPGLLRIARDGQYPVSRMQALSLLHEWDALDHAFLADLIREADAVVARHAMVLAERRLDQHSELVNAMLARVTSDDAALRLQLALSLGEVRENSVAASVGAALAELAIQPTSTREIQAGVLTSLHAVNLPHVLDAVASSPHAAAHREWITELIQQAMAQEQIPIHASALQLIARLPGMPKEWQWSALAECLDVYHARHGSFSRLPAAEADQIREQLRQSREAALDETREETLRQAALRLLRVGLGNEDEIRQSLVSLLDPRQPPSLMEQAASTLIREFPDVAVPELLSAWPAFSPRLQQAILDEMLRRRDLTVTLLTIADEKSITLPLDARRRQQLLGSSNEEIRTLAEKLLTRTPLSSRTAVLDEYLAKVKDDGDAVEGRKVFQRACAVCHEFSGLGHAVGPALAALENRSAEHLLTSILDPNRALEATYREYQIETNDGLTYNGILTEDTSVSLSLLGPESKRSQILRQQVERISATERSLMPEGLERDLTTDQMSDLLAFLRIQQATPKAFAGNRPELVPRRDDGSMRLLAMHAEIYGPELVYEEPNTNLGFWSTSQDYAAWTIESPTAATYTVQLHYACDDQAAGNQFALVCRDQQLTGEVTGTGTWADYRWQRLGTLDLPAGRSRVILRSSGPVRSYLMDLHMILLERAD